MGIETSKEGGRGSDFILECCVRRDNEPVLEPAIPHPSECALPERAMRPRHNHRGIDASIPTKTSKVQTIPQQPTPCMNMGAAFAAAMLKDGYDEESASSLSSRSDGKPSTVPAPVATHGRLRMKGLTYEGQLLDYVEHGDGILTWDDGREYRGQFKAGQFHGLGFMTWPDGRRYAGEYQQDYKHGMGTFTWRDGRCYTGEWVRGKKHGCGAYTNTNGNSRKGVWNEDLPTAWEIPVKPSGSA